MVVLHVQAFPAAFRDREQSALVLLYAVAKRQMLASRSPLLLYVGRESFIPRGARFGANPGSLVQMGGS
jgi:hypothetical protein